MAMLKTLTVNGVTYSVTPIVPADSVTLLASAWVGDGDAYSQVVTIPGVTSQTKVDLQPTSEQLAEFHYKVLAFVAENDGGTVTVYAIGDKPDDDHTIQITKTEVKGTGKIRGNTVGTTMPRPNWSQEDPKKADYIRNKPDVVLCEKQILSEEQKAQARENIGAVDEADVAYINNTLFTVVTGKNLVNPATCVEGLLASSGSITANAAYQTSDFIPIEPNTDYTLVTFGTNVSVVNTTRKIYALYDGNQQMIAGSYTNIDKQSSLTFNTGNASYVRVSGQTNGGVGYALHLEKGSAFTSFEPYVGSVKKLKNLAGGILYGKKWVACGDSFTQGVAAGVFTDGKFAGEYRSYPFLIGLRNDMDVVNLAVGGMTLAYRTDNTNYFSNTTYKNIDDDADYITLKFGINDNNYKSPIGTIDDTNNTTFYGAWNVVLEHIIVTHPLAKIGIIVTNGSSMEYVNATIAIAEKWGIPYLNEATGVLVPTMHRSNKNLPASVVEARLNAFAADLENGDTHPNAAGHEYESTFVENFLRSL